MGVPATAAVDQAAGFDEQIAQRWVQLHDLEAQRGVLMHLESECGLRRDQLVADHRQAVAKRTGVFHGGDGNLTRIGIATLERFEVADAEHRRQLDEIEGQIVQASIQRMPIKQAASQLRVEIRRLERQRDAAMLPPVLEVAAELAEARARHAELAGELAEVIAQRVAALEKWDALEDARLAPRELELRGQVRTAELELLRRRVSAAEHALVRANAHRADRNADYEDAETAFAEANHAKETAHTAVLQAGTACDFAHQTLRDLERKAKAEFAAVNGTN